MNEIKNTAKGNNTKTDLTDDRICDMEVRNAKFIQQKRTATTKNGKEWKKKKLDLWESIKINNFVNDRISRRRKNGEGVK